MIRVVGDIHLRSEEPFFSTTKKFLFDLLEKPFDSEERYVLIFTGDFFHRSRPYSEELACARQFFEMAKERDISIYILAGNHEYFRERDTWAEDVFKDYDIHFYDSPTCVDIQGSLFLMLPWVSTYIIKKNFNKQTLKEFYSHIISKLDFSKSLDGCNLQAYKYLYVIYHFEDETCFTGSEDIGVDLSKLNEMFHGKVVRVGGHIHNPDKNYLGTPYATRKDETDMIRRTLIIKSNDEGYEYETVKEDPIKFRGIEYSELLNGSLPNNCNYILKVFNAPSSEAVIDEIKKNKNYYLDDFELKFNETRTILENKDDQVESIKDFLDMYIKQNKVDSMTANYLISLF